jgi:phage repressor protein C with HTH and peptisase S24 domain
MTTLSERLREARTDANMTQAGLAKAVGIGQSLIGNLESGLRLTSKHIPKIAAALGVSAIWLSDGIGQKHGPGSEGMAPNIATPPRPVLVFDDDKDETDDGYISVPRLTLVASCGTGRMNWEVDLKGTPNMFRKAWCIKKRYNPEKLVTVMAEGDSMSPGIPHGASITLNTEDTLARTGKRYAIDFLGEFFIKRLFRESDGSITIRSDNADKSRFPDWTISTDHMESLNILGRVVSVTYDGDD